MPAPYSDDLRRKAIEAVERGEHKTDVSKMFNISRNTLDLWLKRKAGTGDYQAVTNHQRGCRQKIIDLERFRVFVERNEGKTQAQLAVLWGEGVTQQNISAALQKLGIRQKKRLTDIKNVMELSAELSKQNQRLSPTLIGVK